MQRGTERTPQQGLPGQVSGSGVNGYGVGAKALWLQLIQDIMLNTEVRPEYSWQAGRIQGGEGSRLGAGPALGWERPWSVQHGSGSHPPGLPPEARRAQGAVPWGPRLPQSLRLPEPRAPGSARWGGEPCSLSTGTWSRAAHGPQEGALKGRPRRPPAHPEHPSPTRPQIYLNKHLQTGER